MEKETGDPLAAGSGATEEGLTSRGGRNPRLPLRFGLRPQKGAEAGAGSSFRKACRGETGSWKLGLVGKVLEMVEWEDCVVKEQEAVI